MPCGGRGGGGGGGGVGEVRNNYKIEKENDFMPCGGRNWARGERGGGESRDCEIYYKMQKIRSLFFIL